MVEDAREFIETHVKDIIHAVDIANMPQMEAKEVEEQYDAEAIRRASYIEFLCSKKTVLAKYLHGTKYKDDFASKWRRFTDDRLSNIRRADHPFNSGDSDALVRFSLCADGSDISLKIKVEVLRVKPPHQMMPACPARPSQKNLNQLAHRSDHPSRGAPAVLHVHLAEKVHVDVFELVLHGRAASAPAKPI